MDEIPEEDCTVPRCMCCGRVVIVGGKIVPSEGAIRYAAGLNCARGPGWVWCYYNDQYILTDDDITTVDD